MTSHLNHEQLCDILLARSPHPLSTDFATLQQHLAECPACAAEISNLSASLSRFREASTTSAQQQFTPIGAAHHIQQAAPQPLRKTLFRPVYWAAAAAILVVAAIPVNLHRQHAAPQPASATPAAPAHSIQSDEALLEEISQEISEPIPSPMRPLADPTASALKAHSNSARRNN